MASLPEASLPEAFRAAWGSSCQELEARLRQQDQLVQQFLEQLQRSPEERDLVLPKPYHNSLSPPSPSQSFPAKSTEPSLQSPLQRVAVQLAVAPASASSGQSIDNWEEPNIEYNSHEESPHENGGSWGIDLKRSETPYLYTSSTSGTLRQTPLKKKQYLRDPTLLDNNAGVATELKKIVDMGFGGFMISGRCRERLSNTLSWWANLEEPPRTGFLAGIVGGKRFELLCATVILLNSAFTIYVTNYAMSNSDNPMAQTTFMKIAEPAFVAFYLVELMLKLMVHRHWFFCNEDMSWNLFDLFLVVFATWDWYVSWLASESSGGNIAFMRTLRLMKMSRIVRMFRVIRVFRELKTMIYTLVGSLLALFWCLVMLAFILTIFGLIFVQFITGYIIDKGEDLEPTVHEELALWWGSVQSAMATLYMATTGGQDWVVFYRMLQTTDESGGITSLLFLFYIAFFNFAVYNVLTGIFVEYTTRVSQKDRDVLIIEQRRKERVDAEQLRHLVDGMDEDKSGTISLDEFERYLEDEKVAMLLASLGLDIKDTEAFFQMLVDASENGQVDIDTFIEGCMHLKGHATAIDLQHLIYSTKAIYNQQQSFSLDVDRRMKALTRSIASVRAALDGGEGEKNGHTKAHLPWPTLPLKSRALVDLSL